MVDVNLLLESLKSSDTCIGAWVNVVGYVTKQDPNVTALEKGSSHSTAVQAIVFWSAGSLDINEYERVLSDLKTEDKSA